MAAAVRVRQAWASPHGVSRARTLRRRGRGVLLGPAFLLQKLLDRNKCGVFGFAASSHRRMGPVQKYPGYN